MSPTEQQSAQQALEFLQQVQAKVLVELWITLMMVAGIAAIILAQFAVLFNLKKCSGFLFMVYGFAMTYVPATAALFGGYLVMVLGAAIIVKEVLSDKTAPAK